MARSGKALTSRMHLSGIQGDFPLSLVGNLGSWVFRRDLGDQATPFSQS